MVSGHTSGPWYAHMGRLIRVKPFGSASPVCGVHRRGVFNGTEARGEAEANARLIAAAPELLDACKRLVASYDADNGAYRLSELQAALEIADRAVLKAETQS